MAPPLQNPFDRLIWKSDDCMLLNDLVFRVMHHNTGPWAGGEHFIFYKIKELLDQYGHYFKRCPDFRPINLLELGIFDGGSIAFWHELFNPVKHVALDLMEAGDGPYFRKYVNSRGLEEHIRTYWKTDQADKARLFEIVAAEFSSPLELVIDDASHIYEPTLASFEALFPLMAPGGLYIIEDWAWGHWREGLSSDWDEVRPLTPLAVQLIEATGTWTRLIADIAVYQGFIVVERGSEVIQEPRQFRLEDYIYRRRVKERSTPQSPSLASPARPSRDAGATAAAAHPRNNRRGMGKLIQGLRSALQALFGPSWGPK